MLRKLARPTVLAFVLSLVPLGNSVAAAVTFVVDDDGLATASDCNDLLTPAYMTVSGAAVAANDGDTIIVCPGTYNESVYINESLTLLGAQAGQPVATRVWAGLLESTVNGLVTVDADRVTLDGFSMTNSAPNQNNGILVKTAGDGAYITNNLISVVGSLTLTSNAQGIYLEHGPDNVQILDNDISKIASAPSAKGVYIGDSLAVNASVNTVISGNTITDITSGLSGAYGIQVNNRAGQPGLAILNNEIRTLNGGRWVHAIGLEGDTRNVIVRLNSITNMVSGNVNNSIAVFFEDNPSFSTGHVNFNNFNGTALDYGIAVHPFLVGTDVDGTCNWWNAPNGPGMVGPGAGARVSPKVDFEPWLTSPAPDGNCAGFDESTPGKATGGGQIPGTDPDFGGGGALLSLPALVVSQSNPNEKATFGFVARCCPEAGNLEYNDHWADVRIKALSIDGLFISSPGLACPMTPGSQHAIITGRANVYRSSGTTEESLTVHVDDCGEPGTMDTFGIETDSYSNGPSTLLGGNIQIHK